MINLYEYQKKYLSDLPARAIMAADTGTGKTFMALEHYRRHALGQPLLILAPASKVRTGDWEREIQEYFDDMPADQRQFAYEIYSYEKFSRNTTIEQRKNGKYEIWREHAPRFGGAQYAIICDEVHKVKNPQSGMGKAVYEAAKGANFFVGLSATPLPNGWIDFAGYSKIFGFTKNITEFKKKYVRMVDYKGFPEIVGYYHEDALAAQWRSISKRLMKSEANELPPRTFIGVDFKKTTEYTRVMLDRKTTDGTVLDTAPALTHALRQTLTAPKLDYLGDLIEGTEENIVIFYNYISERTAILELLGRRFKGRKVFRQDGERHELPRKSEWASVSKSITLSHYRSGSTGVEMTYATQVIYFSPTYSYADYVQSIGRVYRNGQSAKTTFYNFRVRNTIEEAVYVAISSKNNFQEAQWVSEQKEV